MPTHKPTPTLRHPRTTNRPTVLVIDVTEAGGVDQLRALVTDYVATWYQPGQELSPADQNLLTQLPGRCVPPAGAALLVATGSR